MNNNDIIRACELLNRGCVCAMVKGETEHVFYEHGIKPLVNAATGLELNGFSVADKIVGKAAALIYVYMGVAEVYAEVLSKKAESVFIKHNIKYSFGSLTENIINRQGNGTCPMELAVQGVDEPSEALEVLKQKLNNMGVN